MIFISYDGQQVNNYTFRPIYWPSSHYYFALRVCTLSNTYADYEISIILKTKASLSSLQLVWCITCKVLLWAVHLPCSRHIASDRDVGGTVLAYVPHRWFSECSVWRNVTIKFWPNKNIVFSFVFLLRPVMEKQEGYYQWLRLTFFFK
jgi:hypothetical protein